MSSKNKQVANKRSRKPEKAPEKSAEELQLEEFLFGKDIINAPQKDEEEEIEITIDTAPRTATGSVWHDDEDEELEVDLTKTNRLKKLRKSDQDPTVITGDVLTNVLQERFRTRQLEWAKVEDTRTAAIAEDRGFDDEDLQLLQQSGSMIGRTPQPSTTTTGASARKSAKNKKRGAAVPYLDDTAAPYLPLPSGQLNIKRLVNANIAEPSKQKITAVNFHPNGDLLLVAGEDKYMRFFRIDGDKNEKQLAVRVQDMIIQNATFRSTTTAGAGAGGSASSGARGAAEEVVLCGRKPFFYSYDTDSGNIAKIPGPPGRGVKSLEHMVVSPDGGLLAFRGASGYVHICSGSSKQWNLEVKMNTAVRSHCFLDDTTLATSGVDADVYIWDLRKTGRCVARFPHDDGTCTSHLSSYTPISASADHSATFGTAPYTLPRSYLAVGAESGVVSVFGADRDGLGGGYDFSCGSTTSALGGVPKQLKSVMNLTTPITSSCFHPSGQILAIASNQKQNQLKLIHLPSYTVFTNWPTQQTPLQRVECLAFSGAKMGSGVGGGGYFAVGNGAGKVLLYQLPHFGSA